MSNRHSLSDNDAKLLYGIEVVCPVAIFTKREQDVVAMFQSTIGCQITPSLAYISQLRSMPEKSKIRSILQ